MARTHLGQDGARTPAHLQLLDIHVRSNRSQDPVWVPSVHSRPHCSGMDLAPGRSDVLDTSILQQMLDLTKKSSLQRLLLSPRP